MEHGGNKHCICNIVARNMYNIIQSRYTGLFEMIVGGLTCHTLEIGVRVYAFFLFTRTKLQVFVTYLTGALYVHPL